MKTKQTFARIPNDKVLYLESHLPAIFFQGWNCYLVTGCRFFLIPVKNYWTHTQFPYMHNVMIDSLAIVRNFRQSIKKMTHLCILQCIFNFTHDKLHFPSITLHARVALKSWYRFLVDAKPFMANQNVKDGRFLCALQIFLIFAGSVWIENDQWFSVVLELVSIDYKGHLKTFFMTHLRRNTSNVSEFL